jgi:catechol 2,3-dioxygenase-like lactoylglutathione lyase family enzyme
MQITGLAWCGMRTAGAVELAPFYQRVLGLTLADTEPDLRVSELPDRRDVEVFDRQYPGRDHFRTGPVIAFAVRHRPAAVEELRRAAVALLGDPGPTRQHFRAPDGNVYALVTS